MPCLSYATQILSTVHHATTGRDRLWTAKPLQPNKRHDRCKPADRFDLQPARGKQPVGVVASCMLPEHDSNLRVSFHAWFIFVCCDMPALRAAEPNNVQSMARVGNKYPSGALSSWDRTFTGGRDLDMGIHGNLKHPALPPTSLRTVFQPLSCS